MCVGQRCPLPIPYADKGWSPESRARSCSLDGSKGHDIDVERDVNRLGTLIVTLQRYCPQCGHALATRRVNGADRQACIEPNCGYVHWDSPVPVVAGVIVYRNGLLLARNKLWPPGRFSLITGYIDHKESPENAVCRELYEELGLTADSARFIGHYLFRDQNQLLIAYALEAYGELKLGAEIVEIREVSLGALTRYDFGPFEITRAIVHDLFASLSVG